MARIRIGGRLITAAACAWCAGPVRALVLRRSRGTGWAASVAVLAGVLAAFGVPGAWQSVAVASSSPVLNWTRQAPATSPPGLFAEPMTYDAATGTVALFSGTGRRGPQSDTWTWNGSTWTKQAPAASPSPRFGAVMAYDAATGTVVLFGGHNIGHALGDTWTWDGSTWTKQTPATSPPIRDGAVMAYDAATGSVVLFGGTIGHTVLGDTWTWDGSTWTQQAPATSPPARELASMAYDAATGTAVLFGGDNYEPLTFNDTWTWGSG